MIPKGNKNGEKCSNCYRKVVDLSHGLRNNALRGHWRLLQAPNAISLWSPKRWPVSDMGKGCWMVTLPETSKPRKPFIMMWKRNSSCCAGGNVNWTAILESNLSEPSEVKDMHNVAFLMSHANQVSGAKHIIIITYSKSPHHFPFASVAWDNTMRTKYHPAHSRVCTEVREP